MTKFVILALLGAVGSAPLLAQRSWVVDATGKGDFTTVVAAVKAAKSRDRILIRPMKTGEYAGVQIGKSLALIGQGTVRIHHVEVSGLAAADVVHLKNLSINPSPLSYQFVPASLLAKSNKGSIHAEDLILGASRSSCMEIRSCRLITFRNCSASQSYYWDGKTYRGWALAAIVVDASVVHFAAVKASGPGASFNYVTAIKSKSALVASRSRITIQEGVYSGGSGVSFSYYGNRFYLAGSPAIALTASDLILEDAGACSISSGSELNPKASVSAIQADAKSTVVVDPRVKLTSSRTKVNVVGVTALSRAMPGLSSGSVRRGGSLALTQHGAPGSLGVLILGAPMPGASTPIGDLWMQMSSLQVFVAAILDKSGRHAHTIGVPAQGLPFSLTLSIQSLEVQGSKLLLSAPAIVLVD